MIQGLARDMQNQNRFLKSKIVYALLFATLTSAMSADELYDDKKVSQIEIVVELPPGESGIDPKPILSRMRTQKGDHFSQLIFDSDLKALSEDYERVEPKLTLKDGKVYIEIHVAPRPVIHQIEWSGNTQFKTSTLQEELGIKSNTVFNRQTFNKAFNKVKEYYFKKGYFESQLSYSLSPIASTNEVDVLIAIHEGNPGYIKEIVFTGFTKNEESELREQMYLKKYNFLISWLSGTGIYRDEALEQDRMMILNYLHNLGYADARVDIEHYEDPESGKLVITINADKGQIYRFGRVSYEGNTLIPTADLQKRSIAVEGSTFSPDKMRETSQAIKDLYGQRGYIDASVQFEAFLQDDAPVFNVDYAIDEGQQYRIGLIHIFGNNSTQNNVILRETLLVPGETFDSRKLKATQQRLEGVGYFKSVNVYAVRNPDDPNACGDTYRDVYIEVEETTTGNVSLFMGFSSVDDIFGGLDLTERNFNIAGVPKAFAGKLSGLRGGGEYFHVRGTIGKKQRNILVSWMNPYVNDTLWRLGVELSTTFSDLQDDVNVKTYGGSVYTNYPLSQYWTVGMRQRLRHSHDQLSLDPYDHSIRGKESVAQQRKLVDQRGLISAFSGNLSYDSIDNPRKPKRGWRSFFETEVAGIGGKYQFFKTSYTNSLYYAVTKKGTFKLRADFKYMIPFGKTDRDHVPYSERFFLGGDNTVRGYKPFLVGPVIHLRDHVGNLKTTHTPKGGLSSSLLSIEYNQELLRMLDIFAFVDVGSVSFDSYAADHIRPTTGVGVRIDIGNGTPIMVGWGIPLVKEDRHHHKWQKVFFSMGGQF
jgi:outer membrane protein insertion porin family